MTRLALGIDLGTSGIRTSVVNPEGAVIARARAAYPPTDPERLDAWGWWHGASRCLDSQIAALRDAGHDPHDIVAITVDGTSGSLVLADRDLAPVTRGLLYNTAGFHVEAQQIARAAPASHVAQGPASALARALRLRAEDTENEAAHLMHQADFVAAHLMGQGGLSDANNALKTGYDPQKSAWPDWIEAAGLAPALLPECVLPGTSLHPISAKIAARFGLSPGCTVHAGTTDSIAAFLAAAPLHVGAAVTSLGTTLAIKVLSERRIDRPEIGLYSHRIGPGWLVGGASNSGGGALLRHFTADQIADLSQDIDPARASVLDYYPLAAAGERFPINDPDMTPRISPRPDSDVAFLHGLLEGIARIEAACYDAIAEFSGPRPETVLTAGGGAENETWCRIRERVIGCRVERAQETEASAGVAKLCFAL